MNEKKLVHTERIAIRWGDMDAMGHVNNTVYFRYMEQARIAWFESLVPRAQAWGEISIVIVNASCNFRRPINYPGTVEVKVFAGAPGGSSVPTYYELLLEDEIYADGDATVVFLGHDQKPLRIPDPIRAVIAK
jgi:acyl-CoA thioester hydrolase